MMTNSLNNKTAIITGASQGIGESIAHNLAQYGCNLILLSRKVDSLNKVKDEILKKHKINISCFYIDISDFQSVEITFNKILTSSHNIDILINNAGITKDNLLLKMPQNDWDDVLNTNLKGCFNCCKHIIKHMIKKRYGKIINITSIIGIIGNSGQINYSASKAGIIGLTKSLSKEVGSRNITVNAVAPGYIKTNMTEDLESSNKDDFLNRIALKKYGESNDVANLVSFLSSDLSSYITGQVIKIDGGLN